ncbi:MAG: endonuclease MutS2 [Cyanobacteria bacterium M5B4]|nr:MAG: endonuclease MutS2 [Cyanobacteria bacterium M5B4]
METLELLEWQRLCKHLSTFAVTKLGRNRALDTPIPSTIGESELLLQQTQECYRLDEILPGGLSLEGIADVSDALKRAERQGVLSALELVEIASTLNGARQLRRSIESVEGFPILQSMVTDLRTYPELEQAIYHCIDESGTVLERASPKLGSIRQNLRALKEQIWQSLQSLMQRKASALQELVITQRNDRYVLSVKAAHKDQIPGVVHDSSGSGMTLFVEPEALVPKNNQLRQLLAQEEREIAQILRNLSEKVTIVATDLLQLLEIVTTIDVALARARYSYWLQASPPQFIDREQTIQLMELRHPLLVWQERQEQGHRVVPVDIKIDPQIRTVVITGPNTGGKTASLKTFGLAALMAKAGLFVAAREPVQIPWFDHVLADIGDEQSLEQNLSTFSGHIKRIVQILSQITPLSLVLLDEIGAGTDPSEGSALAIALLEHFASTTRLTIATTHFGELKALKYSDPRFENASVEFDDLSLAPTYRLLWGIPGRSNALIIAKRLGLDDAILERAQTQVGIGSQEINRVISALEHQRREQEHKTTIVTQLLQDTERLHKEIILKSGNLRTQYQELRLKQEQEVTQAIAQAKKEIARVIRKLQNSNQSVEAVQFAEKRVEELQKRHIPPAPPPPQEYVPQVGDRVRVLLLDKVGQVLTTPNGAGEFSVRVGTIKMTLHLKDIAPLT